MKKAVKRYDILSAVSAICMAAALLWLTVSTPFVFSAQQKLSEERKTEKVSFAQPVNEEESTNPFGGSTEEKAPSGSSLSEEYLHTHNSEEYFFSSYQQYHKCEDAGIYVAFHGELLVPPPNAF